jgi:hypothetical protein
MTAGELAAAGLPAEPIVEGHENAPPPEEGGSPAVSGSRSHKDGELRIDDEDVGDVDAGVGDLVREGQGDLCLLLSFSENRRSLPT